MDKYKKKIFICIAIACVCAYLGVVVLFNLSWMVIVVSSIVLIICAISFLVLNKRMKSYLNPNVYPSNEWYRDHLERNFDYLIVGDRISCTDNEIKEKTENSTVFDVRLADENLYSTFKVIQAAFSIVKEGGTILVPVSANDFNRCISNYEDERRYWFVLRPYCFTMSKCKQIWIKISIRIPALMFRVKDILNLFRKTPKFSKRTVVIDEVVIALLREMKSFSKERNLVLQLLVHKDEKAIHWEALAKECGL